MSSTKRRSILKVTAVQNNCMNMSATRTRRAKKRSFDSMDKLSEDNCEKTKDKDYAPRAKVRPRRVRRKKSGQNEQPKILEKEDIPNDKETTKNDKATNSVSVNTFRTNNVLLMNDFIDCILKNPCLWNKQTKNRPILLKRQEAYKQLHAIYKQYYHNATVDDTKSLFYVVFSGYRKTKRRMESDPTFKPLLWYYPKLAKALKNINDPQKRQNNREFMQDFLDCYKRNKSLWIGSANSRYDREDAFAELLGVYQKHYSTGTLKEVKNFLYTIRKCHRREYHKVLSSNGKHKPQLWYYDILNSFYSFTPRHKVDNEKSDTDGSACVTSNGEYSGSETDSVASEAKDEKEAEVEVEQECSTDQLIETVDLSSEEDIEDLYLDDIFLNIKDENKITIEPITFTITPVSNPLQTKSPETVENNLLNNANNKDTGTQNLTENLNKWKEKLSQMQPKQLNSTLKTINKIIEDNESKLN